MAIRLFHTLAIPCVLTVLGLAISPLGFAEDHETNSQTNDGEVMQQPGAANGSVPTDPQAADERANDPGEPDSQDDGTRPENEDGEAGFGSGAVGMPEEKLPGEQENDD